MFLLKGTLYPLNYGEISVGPFAIIIIMRLFNSYFLETSVGPFVISNCILQPGENTGPKLFWVYCIEFSSDINSFPTNIKIRFG